MDRVREAICTAASDLGEDFRTISERIGLETAYLERFIEQGSPTALPRDIGRRLAGELGLPAGVLEPPRGVPYSAERSHSAAPPDLTVVAGGNPTRSTPLHTRPRSAAS